jgi:HB1, ASXL, restriction endonuclease HTH domain
MNSYLAFAREILLSVRQPLSAKEILKLAYRSDVVPIHLYGKTQHKTLQARLAEDIRRNAHKSAFIRTAPGMFFLREFFSDQKIPEGFKQEYKASRRLYELEHFECLFAKISNQEKQHETYTINKFTYFYESFSHRNKNINDIPVCLFVVLKRGNYVISHRPISKMQDPIKVKKSVGFNTYVTSDDLDLFHSDNLGIEGAVKRVFVEELNALELINDPSSIDLNITKILNRLIVKNDGGKTSRLMLMIASVSFSNYFDPVDRAPHFREMQWVKFDHSLNDVNDIDIFSKEALCVLVDEENHKKYSRRENQCVDIVSTQWSELASTKSA